MAWRFEPGEPLSDAFRRVAAEEIARIRTALVSGPDHAKAVHEARQGFKRLRALSRLGKPALGPAFAGENRRWRDAGRLLAGSRDKTVLLQSYDRLVSDCRATLPADCVQRLREEIVANGVGNDRAGAVEDVQGVLDLLDHAEREVAALNWPKGTRALFRGLRSGQANLRRKFRHARKSEAADALHSWRKRVKDQAAQLRLLRRVVPAEYRARHNKEKAVGEILGEEHDFWLLSEWLRTKTLPPELLELRDRLLGEIDTARSRLRKRAFKRGEAFSSERAEALASAISGAWDSTKKRKAKKPARKSSKA